jgi:hypothetical protein
LHKPAEARLGLDLRDGALQEAPSPHLARRGVPAPRRRRAQDARRAAQEQDALREVLRREGPRHGVRVELEAPERRLRPQDRRVLRAQRRPGLGHGPPRRAHEEVAAEVAADAPRAAGS